LHDEYFTVDTQRFDIHADNVNAYADGNTEVDISGTATLTAASQILTLDAAVEDGETVTIDTTVYEFDTHAVETITGGNIRVDVSGGGTTASAAEVTFANGDLHGDTVVINGNTHTLKSDGTADSATVCDIRGAATIAAGTGTLTLGGIPADGEQYVINARTYEFDPSANGGGNVQILTAGLTTIDQVGAQIETDHNADVSRVCNASYDSGTNTVTFTAITQGVASNYTFTETIADSGISGSGNFTGGADALGTELGTIFLAHLNGAGAEAGISQAAGATTDKVIMTWDVPGTVGNAITLTETLTAGSADGGGTFGGKVAGVDPTKGEAQTALSAAIAGGPQNGIITAGAWGGDASTISWDIQGVINNGKATTTTAAGITGWTAGTSANGVDAVAAEVFTVIVALGVQDSATFSDGGTPAVTVTANAKGVAGNSLDFTENTGTMTVDAAKLGTTVAGVDGTVGVAGEIRWDASNIYICTATAAITDSGKWKKSALSAL
jgi:hypothetical protein